MKKDLLTLNLEYKDKYIKYLIDNQEYNFSCQDMINFFTNDDFEEICINKNIKLINEIPKEHFIYAVLKFIKENSIIENYNLSENTIKTINNLENYSIFDFEAINRYLEIKDTMYQKVNLDSELKFEILHGMPDNLNNLEKAIYIYIKMCNLLTYDPEYYVFDQEGEATFKHQSIDYVSNINLDHNKVVCFEFNVMYANFLDELGIKFQSFYENSLEENYGKGHVFLEFRYDNYLVKADSVTSILLGDISNVKLNKDLVGLTCLNKNLNTQIEFKNMLQKIYDLIKNQEKEKQTNEDEDFENIMNEYLSITENLRDVSLDDKISFFLKAISNCKLADIDLFSYVLQLQKALFDIGEIGENIKTCIIRDNQIEDKKNIVNPIIIIATNLEGFDIEIDETDYYCLIPNKGLKSISVEEIRGNFINGKYEYISEQHARIPGLGRINKNVR